MKVFGDAEKVLRSVMKLSKYVDTSCLTWKDMTDPGNKQL